MTSQDSVPLHDDKGICARYSIPHRPEPAVTAINQVRDSPHLFLNGQDKTVIYVDTESYLYFSGPITKSYARMLIYNNLNITEVQYRRKGSSMFIAWQSVTVD